MWRPSDTHGLSQSGGAYVGGERCFGDDIHSTAEEPLELNLEPRKIEQGTPGLQFNQQVDVALFTLLASGHGAEHANITGAVRGGGDRYQLANPF
jgi:hypothetical protein